MAVASPPATWKARHRVQEGEATPLNRFPNGPLNRWPYEGVYRKRPPHTQRERNGEVVLGLHGLNVQPPGIAHADLEGPQLRDKLRKDPLRHDDPTVTDQGGQIEEKRRPRNPIALLGAPCGNDLDFG